MSSDLLVPVIDVQSNNFKELWPSMVLAFKTASFIAVDTELSGLGTRKALLAESIEDRYKAISHAARTRSILSLGIACYRKLDDKAEDQILDLCLQADGTYVVQVYNLTLLCAEEYVIEPFSVQFLVQHGFDFNKQYAQGVPYNKGNDKGGDTHPLNVRSLFVELLRARKPLVVHNGLIDMVFLYQCFYAHLPEKLDTFIADLSQIFPAGIYDTKYATEFELRLTASYLEYAYKKCKLDNSRLLETSGNAPRLTLEFCNYTGHLQSYVDYRLCSTSQNHDATLNVCLQFSAYGWCRNGPQCTMSHDTDLIVQRDEHLKESKRKKRKRKKDKKDAAVTMEETPPQDKRPNLEPDDNVANPDAMMTSERQEDADQEEGNHGDTGPPGNEPSKKSLCGSKERKAEGGTHRAGFDAFMTGYVFAFASLLNSGQKDSTEDDDDKQQQQELWLPECLNKLYLSGKSVPLHVVKSSFSKSSKAHVQKMAQVWGKRSKTEESAV